MELTKEKERELEKGSISWLMGLGMFDIEAHINTQGAKRIVSRLNNREEELERERRAQAARMHRGTYRNTAKPVVKLTLNGDLVASFTSITRAANASGVDPSSIKQCCEGIRSMVGGYAYMFKVEWDDKQAKEGAGA